MDHPANQQGHDLEPGRALWVWWVLAGLLGFGVGGPLGVALGTPGYIVENGFMSIAFGGVLTAGLQWLALRRRLATAVWWTPACVIGAVVFGVIVFSGLWLDSGSWITDVTWIVGALLFMPVAALLQWRWVLRPGSVPRAAWWIAASLAAFFVSGIGSAVVAVPLGLADKEGGADAAVVWSLFGAIYGALTGGVLVRLLRRPIAAGPESAG